MCLCVTCMHGVCRCQKRELDPLELEVWLRADMWVLGVELGSSGRAVSALYHRAIAQALLMLKFKSSL